MRRHEVLRQAIGDHSIDIAEFLKLSAEAVRSWQREPFNEESPTATGKLSPLDRFADLFLALCFHNPAGADILLDYLRWLRHQQRGTDLPVMDITELTQKFVHLRSELNKTIMALQSQSDDPSQ